MPAWGGVIELGALRVATRGTHGLAASSSSTCCKRAVIAPCELLLRRTATAASCYSHACTLTDCSGEALRRCALFTQPRVHSYRLAHLRSMRVMGLYRTQLHRACALLVSYTTLARCPRLVAFWAPIGAARGLSDNLTTPTERGSNGSQRLLRASDLQTAARLETALRQNQ